MGILYWVLLGLVCYDVLSSSNWPERPYWGPIRHFFPGVGHYGVLSHGGCFYFIWAFLAVTYAGFLWLAPAVPWRQTSMMRGVGRFLVTLFIGATVFLVFFWTQLTG